MSGIKLDIHNKAFPDQVKYVRMVLQLSQTELAEQIGVSYATVSRWERENRKPQLAMLGKFYSFCLRNGIEPENTEQGDQI
ncbi:MAG: helix-turn-helix transcriptional regulator [Ruminococcaceae bacterium]|nr:helix-turn-helix transcriptional regulator [Oscillospiraceae bacterium]